jgi:chromosomal replication initiation ATPase DnaA
VTNKAQFEAEVKRLWEAHEAHIAEQRRRFPAKRILAAVAAAHDLTVDQLQSVQRKRQYCRARHHAAWELRRRRLDLGLSQIAAHLNRTDHTTAHHSYTTFCAMVAQGRYAAERARVETILAEANNE